MEAEDVINLAATEDEDDDIHECVAGPVKVDSQPISSAAREGESRVESMELNEGNAVTDASQFVEETIENKDFIDDSSIIRVNAGQNETVESAGTETEPDTTKHVQNGFLDVQNESPIHDHRMDVSSISGVKRARMEFDEEQPSVHVIYKSLTRSSKQKLEELLQQWSEWQVQCGSSSICANETVESGEETFFPAIYVGSKKGSAVSFWIDNQTRNQQNEGFIPLDSNSTPLYDRGYALGLTLGDDSSNLEGGLKIIDDASRCFNCGSYSHSLKECPKPRDNAAVQNARQQMKSKRNQNSASRNPTRYYQNSAGGKYDGLRPGALDAETRRLLGLGELDPPPWLNRMRELGYPPGYLDPDDEDQPSGITIFADGEEQEDGEIIETDTPEPQRKMSVKFPGINAPIPENADERLWAAGPSNSEPSRDRPQHRLSQHSESISKGHHRDQRWSRDSRDDGPPGCDLVSSYPPRHGGHEFGYYSRSRSPIIGRSQSERGRRSPLVYEDYIGGGLYRRMSPPEYGVGRYETDGDRYRDDSNLGRYDEYDRHRHRSSRW